MSALPMAGVPANINTVGLTKNDYRGAPTTLCAGCGHNSISNQIIAAMYEMSVLPENVIKFSGIGCSSKSPTYFMNRSFGFNSLHGRMPSIATGAHFGDHSLKGIGVSGDGDTASIGMGQFKHVMRRNLNMVYIVENNGVYGLTKGQFSATAERGLELKKQGDQPLHACGYLHGGIDLERHVRCALVCRQRQAGERVDSKPPLLTTALPCSISSVLALPSTTRTTRIIRMPGAGITKSRFTILPTSRRVTRSCSNANWRKARSAKLPCTMVRSSSSRISKRDTTPPTASKPCARSKRRNAITGSRRG
jgi:hypothetical protein